MTMANDPLWMTATALRRLEEELAEITQPGRPESSEDQARASELREMIRRAEVETKPNDGLVEPGMRVTVRFEGDDSTMTFLLGSRELADLDTAVGSEVYSPTSPLGAAITGRSVGDSVSYSAPNGTLKVTIVEAVPFA